MSEERNTSDFRNFLELNLRQFLDVTLKGITDRLDETNRQVAKAFEMVASHERWIRERDRSIDAADDRFETLEQSTDELQKFVDEYNAAKTIRDDEWAAMKKKVDDSHEWILGTKANKVQKVAMLRDAATIIGIAAILVKLFWFHN